MLTLDMSNGFLWITGLVAALATEVVETTDKPMDDKADNNAYYYQCYKNLQIVHPSSLSPCISPYSTC